MTGSVLKIRPAVPADAEAMASVVSEGLDGYRDFSPPGWKPPGDVTNPGVLRERIDDGETWIAVAPLGDGDLAGIVGATSARRSRPGTDAPADLAHLWLCFVRGTHLGTGLAPRLLAWGVQGAQERGFARMRLFAAAGQKRARRFYEREGWTPGEPFDDPGFGMALVEFRREL
jgi:GNAT superfamily N-acetyltransferase